MSEALHKFHKLPDVLWAFGRLPGEKRLTLAQSPMFYAELPTISSGAYRKEFINERTNKFVDSGRVYVLTSGTLPIFVECNEKLRMLEKLRVFDNVWQINDVLIF